MDTSSVTAAKKMLDASIVTPTTDAIDVPLVTAANNKFALDLFKILYDGNQNQNTFVSPFSISVALAMTHLGAREETAQGMAKALRWETDDETKLHEQFQAYVTQLQTPNDQYQLSTANRIYIEKSYAVLDEFKNKTKKYYNAEPVSCDFKTDADNQRLHMNRWVSEQTQNRVNDLLAPGIVNEVTRMLIVNAIYFKGLWERKFDEAKTKLSPFKVKPGLTKDVHMMSIKHEYSTTVSSELGCTAVEIPYKGRKLSMVVILPSEDFGLQNLVHTLTNEKLNSLLATLSSSKREVQLSLPKFEVTSSVELKEPLCTLGMAQAFDGSRANFTGISSTPGLSLQAAVHRAYVKVTEEGTEAAAATSAAVVVAVCLRLPCVVNVDHPFMFLIREGGAGGNILFMGCVTDPSR
ncbi:leukocyte elastase inhibitor-like [Physella acuta]|uniref:leukocyte elastase inhibitor-like n=1 Tax=Physella acuta TaxID=109671 RepID=UPI0027DD8C0B|nr:leukocyte elastase inhibitor-like [Physella acuta]